MWVIIWNRAGFLVPILFGAGWLIADHIGSAFSSPEQLVGPVPWRTILGAAIGGYANWRLGRYLNADEDFSDKHRFYFVPMEIWGLLGLVASIGGFAFFARPTALPPGPVASAPPPARHSAAPPAPVPGPLSFLSSSPPFVSSTSPARTPAASVPPHDDYKLSAIIRSGSDPSRWLFEVVSPGGERHFARCGEQVDDWTVTAFTNDVLILNGTDGRSRQLRAPRNL